MAVVAKWLTHWIVAPTFVGSIPINRPIIYCGCGGIGRRTRLRIWRLWRGGSSPFTRTIYNCI